MSRRLQRRHLGPQTRVFLGDRLECCGLIKLLDERESRDGREPVAASPASCWPGPDHPPPAQTRGKPSTTGPGPPNWLSNTQFRRMILQFFRYIADWTQPTRRSLATSASYLFLQCADSSMASMLARSNCRLPEVHALQKSKLNRLGLEVRVEKTISWQNSGSALTNRRRAQR